MAEKPKSAPKTATEKEKAAAAVKETGKNGTNKNGKDMADDLATPKKIVDREEIKKRMGYSEVGEFEDGVAIAVKKGVSSFLINEKGNRVGNEYYEIEEFNDGIAIAHHLSGEDSHQITFINKKGLNINNKTYWDAHSCSEGKAGVKEKGKKWIFIDVNGKDLKIGEFDEVYDFYKGIAGVRNGQYWKFIKADGSKLNDKSYSRIDDFEDGVAHGKRDGVWYVIDLKGVEKIAPKGHVGE